MNQKVIHYKYRDKSQEIRMNVTILDNPELLLVLERCRDLPTPPGVAEQIIGLSSDSNSDISVLAEVVSLDPALTVKICVWQIHPCMLEQRKWMSLRASSDDVWMEWYFKSCS